MINIESNNVDLQLSIIQLYNFYKLNSPPPPLALASLKQQLPVMLSLFIYPLTYYHVQFFIAGVMAKKKKLQQLQLWVVSMCNIMKNYKVVKIRELYIKKRIKKIVKEC